jgi:polar amino acid transport system substrate-binding protein
MKKIITTIFIMFFSMVTVFADTGKTFVVGLDDTFAPMGFKDKNGQIVGFDVDLAKEVASRLKLKIIFKPCVWDTIFLELKNGNIDAIWNGVTMNPEREANALFSKPYMTNRVIILVNADSNINKLADLKGKKVAAQAGAPAADYIAKYKGKDFNPATLKELVQYPDNSTALFDLANKGVDAVSIDEIFADYYMKNSKVKFKKVSGFFTVEQDGIAFRKNDVELRNKVQGALDSMIKDGTASKISEKWFGRDVFKQGVKS